VSYFFEIIRSVWFASYSIMNIDWMCSIYFIYENLISCRVQLRMPSHDQKNKNKICVWKWIYHKQSRVLITWYKKKENKLFKRCANTVVRRSRCANTVVRRSRYADTVSRISAIITLIKFIYLVWSSQMIWTNGAKCVCVDIQGKINW